MGDNITLNTKEVQRSIVLINTDRGFLTGVQAAEVLGLSVRQVRRVLFGLILGKTTVVTATRRRPPEWNQSDRGPTLLPCPFANT
ncbi:MAG TPA: hypothetical protein VKT80_03055 [Chloroflexota bacterium]|nr:hypothetical protein [Chloroflexota bacterium]